MKCSKCKQECAGFATGDVDEDVCEDCGFPEIAAAVKFAGEEMKKEHLKRTGKEWVPGFPGFLVNG